MQPIGIQTQFLALDALRGLAALAVAVFHFSSIGWGGYLAVDFFLVLSGFILSHSYLYRYETVNRREFIGHRLARLYPLHIYTLATFVGVTLLASGSLPSYKDGNLFTLFQQITLTHNVGLNPGGMTWNYPSWSISVEFWVNVIFVALVSRATSSLFLVTAALYGLAVVYINTGHLDTHAANYYGVLNSGMIRGLSSFFLGVLCYRIYLHLRNRPDTTTAGYSAYLELACLVGVGMLVFGRKATHSNLDFLAPILFMLVVVVFAFENGRISAYLKKASYLGVMSYSVYLNQITVLLLSRYLAERLNAPGVVFFAFYLALLPGWKRHVQDHGRARLGAEICAGHPGTRRPELGRIHGHRRRHMSPSSPDGTMGRNSRVWKNSTHNTRQNLTVPLTF